MSNISGVSGSSAGLFSTISVNNQLATTTNTTTGPLGNLFASLNLTTAQQSKINQILQNAQSQGLTPAQVQSQINAVLTPAQRSTLQNELSQQGQQPPGGFANLNLTSAQQSQIQKILQKAKSEGLSQSQVQAEINAILTPAQQTTLQNDLKKQHQNQSSSNSSGSTDDFGIPTTLASASTTSASAISEIAASYSVQSQYQDD
jgi:Spy/CpxP family protein refolding chaperone